MKHAWLITDSSHGFCACALSVEDFNLYPASLFIGSLASEWTSNHHFSSFEYFYHIILIVHLSGSSAPSGLTRWDWFWAALPLKNVCVTKTPVYHRVCFLFSVTQTVLCPLTHHWNLTVSVFFCACVCPARSTDFQNCSRWGETEFPTMLGTQYALIRHTVQLQRADLSAAEKPNNVTLPVTPPSGLYVAGWY